VENLYKYNKLIQQQILSKAFHPYLRRFLKEPTIEEKKILLLITLLKELTITDEERDRYITATMLVQVALDTHDGVTLNTLEHDAEALQNRQLTVLAGDYYSGLYYYILAQLGNIELIRSLAEGIKEINEQKIIYHQNNFDNEESILRTVMTIESSLIIKVAECFQLTKFKDLIQSCLLLNLLQNESSKFLDKKDSSLYQAFAKVLFAKEIADLAEKELESLHVKILDHTESTQQDFERAFRLLFLRSEHLSSVFETLIHEKDSKVNSGVEEG